MPGPNEGRRGYSWQNVQRPAALTRAQGRCYLCGSTVCPKCGKRACGGRTPPGQVHHLASWAENVELRGNPANHVAAHGCCNRDAERRDRSVGSRW